VSEPQYVFISAGEASGDNYGAMILQALRERLPDTEFFGCAGTRLSAAGCEAVVDASSVSMVGLVEVIPGLPKAWRALQALKHAIQMRKPKLAILIDFPDFNLRLAEELKRHGVPVLYFVAPQVWAWRKGRLQTIRRLVDRLMCLFPFEEKFFREAGINAEFVGHPLVSRARPAGTREEFLRAFGLKNPGTLIALLPGSRRREVQLNLPAMIEAARILSAERTCEFILPAAPQLCDDWLRRQLGNFAQRVRIVRECFYDAVGHARAAIVASGTASTETAILGTPMVIVYRVTRLSWWLGRRLVDLPYFSIVNLVAGREVVRELIQDNFTGPAVAGEISRLLDDGPARDRLSGDLREVTSRLVRVFGSGLSPGMVPKSSEIADPIQRTAAIAESMIKEAV
jgi:lipid-A-disaccharide synthase